MALLPLTAASLRLTGFNRTVWLLERWSRGPRGASDLPGARATADAVGLVAGRPVVGARCLGRSLVLWFLLRRRGIDASLVIGAAPEGGERLRAHAWVEVDGEPVNDEADVRERFGTFGLRLPGLEARR